MERLTDRERILTRIIYDLYFGHRLGSVGARFTRGGFLGKVQIRPGDIVLALTRTGLDPNAWSISEVVEPRPDIAGFLVRDLVTGETCAYGNESFVVIDGLDRADDVWLCGARRPFVEKVEHAFSMGRENNYRYGGTHFDSDSVARVTVRCIFNGMGAADTEAIPFEVPISFTADTTADDILAALRAGGYGTHEFQYRPRQKREPT